MELCEYGILQNMEFHNMEYGIMHSAEFCTGRIQKSIYRIPYFAEFHAYGIHTEFFSAIYGLHVLQYSVHTELCIYLNIFAGHSSSKYPCPKLLYSTFYADKN